MSWEKCLAGELYDAMFEGREDDHRPGLDLCWEFNQLRPSLFEERMAVIRKLFGRVGKNFYMEPCVECGFGFNVEFGDDCYVNSWCHFMDPAKIIFGNHVYIGPDCGFYTAHHPIHKDLRNQNLEYAFPITVGDDVWIGGHTVIVPGVTIGSDVVIGAGSVVTKDIPSHVVAFGNPCRVYREITEEDRLGHTDVVHSPFIREGNRP